MTSSYIYVSTSNKSSLSFTTNCNGIKDVTLEITKGPATNVVKLCKRVFVSCVVDCAVSTNSDVVNDVVFTKHSVSYFTIVSSNCEENSVITEDTSALNGELILIADDTINGMSIRAFVTKSRVVSTNITVLSVNVVDSVVVGFGLTSY